MSIETEKVSGGGKKKVRRGGEARFADSVCARNFGRYTGAHIGASLPKLRLEDTPYNTK